MILNNYKNWLAFISSNVFVGNNQVYEIGVKDLTGASATLYTQISSSSSSTPNYSLKNGLSARVGTGTTEPTLADVCLETDVTSSITNLNVTSSTQASSGVISTIITITGLNATASSITLSEIGITKQMATGYNAGMQYKTVMLIRSLLDNPLTVPAGEGFTLTFKWDEQ